jgi:rRNA maturation endonuclease Nob1
MKSYKNSILSYKCVEGCGAGIYNATKEMKVCPECGGKLRKVKSLDTRRNRKEKTYED